MTKENAIIGELLAKVGQAGIDLSGLERRTILWITKPRGYSILMTFFEMERARVADVLRKLNLPAGREECRGVRRKFDDLTKAGFLNREQEGDAIDKYYVVTNLGQKLASACAMVINSMEKQSMEKIENEGGNLTLLDLVREFAQPGADSRDPRVGEIPEFPRPTHLNSVKENDDSNRGVAGNGNYRYNVEKRGFNPLDPATGLEDIIQDNSRDGKSW